MDTFFGLPAHPLLVHIPVVLVPLAALGVIAMVARPVWRDRYRWPVLVIGWVGALGAILSASAGEDLERRLRAAGERNTWHEHAEAGETARTFAIVFAVALTFYVIGPCLWARLRRSSSGDATTVGRMPVWLAVGLSVLVVGAALVSVVAIVDAGHSGAESVWESGD